VVIIVVIAVIGFGMLACGGVLVALLLPAISAARQAAQRMEATNNLKQVAIGLHNYHDTYTSFPPQYIKDADGNPRYSWRTALLPFIEQQALWDQYDSSVGWDDPSNQQTVTIDVPAYQSVRDPDVQGTALTNIVAISGPGTAFDGEKATKIRDFLDGTSNTLIAVEVIGFDGEWAEPRDLPLDQIRLDGSPGDLDPTGFLGVFADGSARFLSGVTLSDLKAMATIAGGEIVSPDSLGGY
ncbi:MAG: DUF1559 domain-containing protein, partial [Pirellulaceae bacterium]|nr:DUF1559 domain-containing protein [Pirellulaceae bacterium]